MKYRLALLAILGALIPTAHATMEPPSGPWIIAQAQCDETGLHIIYRNLARLEVSAGKRTHTTCQELKVSADKKAAAWVMACTEQALNGKSDLQDADGITYPKVCTHLSGVSSGQTFEIDAAAAAIDHLSFRAATHHLAYHSAPMQGAGAHVLFDLDARKKILTCADDDTSAKCAELAKK